MFKPAHGIGGNGILAITVRMGERFRKATRGAFVSAQLPRRRGKRELIPTIPVENLMAVRIIVAGTHAFGAASLVQIEPWLRSGELAVVPFRVSWLRLDYRLIFLASRSLSPAAEAITTLVRRIGREALP